MMSPIEEGKLYKLEGRGLIRHYVEMIVLLFLLWIGIHYTLDGFQVWGLKFFSFDSGNLFKFFFLFAGNIFILWLFYLTIFYCNHGIITKETVIGLNGYRIKRGEVRFDDIDEIRSYGINYNILVKSRNGKKLILATTIQPTEEFFNEIIRRAVNCQRIDLRYIRKRYKNLLIYEKGINE